MTGTLFERSDIDALLAGRHPDPFACLGPHGQAGSSFAPCCPARKRACAVAGRRRTRHARVRRSRRLLRGDDPARRRRAHYLLAIDWPDARQVIDDAYAFGTLLDDAVLARFSAGDPAAVLDCLGAAPTRIDDTDGVRFAVWAPNAQRVSVVGDFNGWDGRRHPMRLRRPSGVWELFVPGIGAGEC